MERSGTRAWVDCGEGSREHTIDPLRGGFVQGLTVSYPKGPTPLTHVRTYVRTRIYDWTNLPYIRPRFAPLQSDVYLLKTFAPTVLCSAVLSLT